MHVRFTYSVNDIFTNHFKSVLVTFNVIRALDKITGKIDIQKGTRVH